MAQRRGRVVPAALAVVLATLAVLLVLARLFTCVLILADDPTTFFAVKRHPSAASVVWAGDAPLRRDYILLDDDENGLGYEAAYLATMRHVPALAAGLLLAAAVAVAVPWPRRPRVDRSGA